MINPDLLKGLADNIELWMNENCEDTPWANGVGFVSSDCSTRLATICLLVLEESKLGQEYASRTSLQN